MSLQHGLARRSPKPGALTAATLRLTTAETPVHHKRGQSLAFDVFRDNHKRLTALRYGFQQGKQFVYDLRQLLFTDEDVGIFHFNAHLVGVG